VSSRRLICWLTVDCVRWTRSPARVKPPPSTTETKLRRRSMSSMAVPFIFPLDLMISFNFQMATRIATSTAEGDADACRPAGRGPAAAHVAAADPGGGVLPDLELGLRDHPGGARRLSAPHPRLRALPDCGRDPARRRRDIAHPAPHAPRPCGRRAARRIPIVALSRAELLRHEVRRVG